MTDTAGRAAKLADYERDMPGFVIDGASLNEVYYLPERRPDARLADVPAADAAAVAAFLEAGERVPAQLRRPVPAALGIATADEIARLREGRRLDETAYAAQITLRDDDRRLVSGEWRTFDVEVFNRGDAHWPGGMDALPQIRLAYRWRAVGGAPAQEGARTPLPAPLAPGAGAVVPLQVLGPPEAGTHEIEIDLVHEDVRWFGAATVARIAVRAPAGDRRATRTSAI